MGNITKHELINMNNALISVDDITGEKISSLDHRTMNIALLDFILTLLPIDIVSNSEGKLVDARLIKRTVAMCCFDNLSATKGSFYKPFSSDTLEFINGNSIGSGVSVTVFFDRQ